MTKTGKDRVATPRTEPQKIHKKSKLTAVKKTARKQRNRISESPKQRLKSSTSKLSKPEVMLSFVEDLKRQWMATIDALVDPLAIVGRDYKIQKANVAMARMNGKDVREVIGKKCFEIFAGRKQPCPGCQMLSATSTSKTFELTDVRGELYYEATSQALFDSKGEVEGIVQVYRDRTEARKLRDQLAQQDKLASIGLLAGGIAHEINNPLGGILVFSQMLLRELPKNSSHYTDVVEIEAATQRCKAIVESLLDFARQNPTGKKEHRALLDVLETIGTALRFGEVSIPRRSRIDIVKEFDNNSHPLFGDRNRMIQVFLNLIQNGIQAMPDGGRLIIRSSSFIDANGKPWGRYEVEDTGVGIPPENLKKIFDPFFTTKDPGEGTGLGLSLSYSFIQDQGGFLRVESILNSGTTFIIELPLLESAMPELHAS